MVLTHHLVAIPSLRLNKHLALLLYTVIEVKVYSILFGIIYLMDFVNNIMLQIVVENRIWF